MKVLEKVIRAGPYPPPTIRREGFLGPLSDSVKKVDSMMVQVATSSGASVQNSAAWLPLFGYKDPQENEAIFRNATWEDVTYFLGEIMAVSGW